MVIIAALVLLFALFFVLRKNIGPAHLAMLAGLSVFEMFGTQMAEFISRAANNFSLDFVKNVIYLVLVAAFPLLLYVRSGRGGLFGLLRIVEAALFAVIMTSLIASSLQFFLPFDGLSTQILSYIENVKGPIVMVGIAAAYVDILLYR